MGYDDQTHAELAELLKERGMDVPKTKQERIDALTEADASSPFLHRVQERYPWATVPVIAVVVMFKGSSGKKRSRRRYAPDAAPAPRPAQRKTSRGKRPGQRAAGGQPAGRARSAAPAEGAQGQPRQKRRRPRPEA